MLLPPHLTPVFADVRDLLRANAPMPLYTLAVRKVTYKSLT